MLVTTKTNTIQLTPRVITHLATRHARFRQATHHHGALYDEHAETIVQRCEHEHPTVDAAVICAHQMQRAHLPAPIQQ
jgi:hypothetical protein